jgi:hypothetical protein
MLSLGTTKDSNKKTSRNHHHFQMMTSPNLLNKCHMLSWCYIPCILRYKENKFNILDPKISHHCINWRKLNKDLNIFVIRMQSDYTWCRFKLIHSSLHTLVHITQCTLLYKNRKKRTLLNTLCIYLAFSLSRFLLDKAPK